MTTATCASCTDPAHRGDDHFDDLAKVVRDRFARLVTKGERLYKTVDASKLGVNADVVYDAFIANLLPSDQQVHRCTACRHFLRRYGDLVTIDEEGKTTSVLWAYDDASVPSCYRAAITAMHTLVERMPVVGVHLSSEITWGTPITGEWRHFAVVNPSVHEGVLITADQRAAAIREDRATLGHALGEFSHEVVDKVAALLETDAMFRSEKVLGPGKWFGMVQMKLAETKNHNRHGNLLWRFAATAPTGFCHIKSSMIGTLLEDVKAGLDTATISRKFREKMDPLQYQRPTAAPAAGNVKRAEEVFEKLGLARSLERRFARLEDVELIWRPRAAKEAERREGLFAHVRTKDGSGGTPEATDLGTTTTMTFVKFRDKVLPTAEEIECVTPTHGSYMGVVTAVHADAPPLLQWSNPVSVYVYVSGSPRAQWQLASPRVKVTGVMLMPWMWGGQSLPNHSPRAMLVLEGCRDSRKSGLALFPETLRSELREVRATIEAHSSTGTIAGRDEASASGLEIIGAQVRVRVGAHWSTIKIDRWD